VVAAVLCLASCDHDDKADFIICVPHSFIVPILLLYKTQQRKEEITRGVGGGRSDGSTPLTINGSTHSTKLRVAMNRVEWAKVTERGSASSKHDANFVEKNCVFRATDKAITVRHHLREIIEARKYP
jgi:hypothetical protein